VAQFVDLPLQRIELLLDEGAGRLDQHALLVGRLEIKRHGKSSKRRDKAARPTAASQKLVLYRLE
jgi:hypothetical protein